MDLEIPKKLKIFLIYCIPYFVSFFLLIPRGSSLGITCRVCIGFSCLLGPIGMILALIGFVYYNWFIGALLSLSIWILFTIFAVFTKLNDVPIKGHVVFVGIWYLFSFAYAGLLIAHAV